MSLIRRSRQVGDLVTTKKSIANGNSESFAKYVQFGDGAVPTAVVDAATRGAVTVDA